MTIAWREAAKQEILYPLKYSSSDTWVVAGRAKYGSLIDYGWYRVLLNLFSVFAFIWGAVWGSFLNVVIYRLPREMSLVRPGSHCPRCRAPIRWFDNIPVLSWSLLRGKCRNCGEPFSVRYALVEALTGSLSLLLFLKCAQGSLDESELWAILTPFAFYFVFFCVLIVVSFIDLDTTLIPDVLTLPTAGLGVLGAFLISNSGTPNDFHPRLDWIDSLVGIGVGFGFFLIIFYTYRLLTGRVGLGGGDITMAAMIGAFVGWQGLIFVLFFASFQGTLIALGASLFERLRGRRSPFLLRGVHRPEYWDAVGSSRGEEQEHYSEDENLEMRKLGVPFGPFLGLAAVEYVFLGELFELWMSGGLGLAHLVGSSHHWLRCLQFA